MFLVFVVVVIVFLFVVVIDLFSYLPAYQANKLEPNVCGLFITKTSLEVEILVTFQVAETQNKIL